MIQDARIRRPLATFRRRSRTGTSTFPVDATDRKGIDADAKALSPSPAARTASASSSPLHVPGAIPQSRPGFIPDFLRTAPLSKIFAWIEARDLGRELAASLGDFLGTRFMFNHFITVTLRRHYKDGRPVPGGRGRIMSAWKYVRRTIRQANQGIDVAGIMVMEFQQDGTPHLHLLSTNTVALIGSERKIQEIAWETFGKCQVLRYRPNLGANFYLAKYIGKESRVELHGVGRLDRYRLPRKDTDRDEVADRVVRRQEQAIRQTPAD